MTSCRGMGRRCFLLTPWSRRQASDHGPGNAFASPRFGRYNAWILYLAHSSPTAARRFPAMSDTPLSHAGRSLLDRRSFLQHGGTGLGGIALLSLLAEQGL